MKIAFVTLFPEMFEAWSNLGMIGRAKKQGLLDIACFNIRDFSQDKNGKVDDSSFGGGSGMVMQCQPIEDAMIHALHWANDKAKRVYLSPQARIFHAAQARAQADTGENIILLCGRYEGIDERILQLCIDEQWSIGEFVLNGGEVAAMAVIEAVTRFMPDIIGSMESVEQDSFERGLLDYPHYTQPRIYKNIAVPDVLLKGNHAKIACWRNQQAVERTDRYQKDLQELKNK